MKRLLPIVLCLLVVAVPRLYGYQKTYDMTCIVSESGMLPMQSFNPLSHFNPSNIVAVGANTSFTISPNSSCQRNYWANDGEIYSSTPNSDPLGHNAINDTHIKLFALQNDKFPVNFSADPNGEVAAFIDTTGGSFTPAFLEITSGEQIATESQVILLAKPSEGYHLVGWTLAGDTIGKENHLVYKVTNGDNTIIAHFAEGTDTESFPVHFSASDGGKIAAQTSIYKPSYMKVPLKDGYPIKKGTSVSFTAMPDTLHLVKTWSVNGVIQERNNGYKSFSHYFSKEDTIKVEFEQFVARVVTFEATPAEGGDVTVVNHEYKNISSGDVVPDGSKITVYTQNKDGYVFDYWEIDGVHSDEKKEPNIFDYKVTRDVSFKAFFRKLAQMPVTFSANGAGSVEGEMSGTKIKSGKSIQEGTYLRFIATPDNGAELRNWTINGVDTLAGMTTILYRVLKEKDNKIVANFESTPVAEYAVTFSADPAEGGKVKATGYIGGQYKIFKTGETVPDGSFIDFEAVANEGYEFEKFTINGADVTPDSANPNKLSQKISGETNIVAHFKSVTPKITITYTAGEHGKFEAVKEQKEGEDDVLINSGDKVEKGAHIVFSVAPDKGYMVDKWFVNGEEVHSKEVNSYNATFDESSEVKVTFRKPKLTLASAEGGKIVAKVDGTEVPNLSDVALGAKVSIEATPKDGYELTALTANDKDILAAKSFEMKGDTEVKAVFTKNKTYKVTLKYNDLGTISIKEQVDLNAVPEGTKLTVVAKGANDKCELKSLTANGEDILKDKTFTVTKDTEVVAVFVDHTGLDAVATQAFSIYPNPARESATVTGLAPESVVALYTLDGQLITHLTADRLGRLQINLSALSDGTYLVVTEGAAQRLVVQH